MGRVARDDAVSFSLGKHASRGASDLCEVAERHYRPKTFFTWPIFF
jgi:hypothetical protein